MTTTDHIVRYQNGLACLTSTSIEDAETVAGLLRDDGVKDVRIFRRVTEVRETEIVPPEVVTLACGVTVPVYVQDGPDQLKALKRGIVAHTASTGCKEWMAGRDGCARAILTASDGFFVGEHDAPIRFCPWCGEGVK